MHDIDLSPLSISQGCGLGLDVSVSRRSRVPTRLGLVSKKNVNISVSSWSRPFTSCAQDQFSAKLCRPQYAMWTGFRRCSYYCSSNILTR